MDGAGWRGRRRAQRPPHLMADRFGVDRRTPFNERIVNRELIDTLAQVTPGANENSGEHMNAIIKRCQRIMSELNCLVIIVHHSGKDASRGSRGWSGMRAALDTEINIQAKASESVAKISKQIWRDTFFSGTTREVLFINI